MPAGRTSWSRAGSRWRSCGPIRREYASRWRLAMRSTPPPATAAYPLVSPPRPDGSSCTGELHRCRSATAADLHRTGVEPAVAARPRRPVPARTHLREGSALLRDAAPPGRQPAPTAPDPEVELHPDTADGAASPTATGWRSQRRRAASGAPRSTAASPRRRRVRPARLVRAVRGARPARLPTLRSGQRQPEPRAQPDTQRSDQRQLPLRAQVCNVAPLIRPEQNTPTAPPE